MTTAPLLAVDDLRLRITSRAETHDILRGISFTVGAGEALGLVGESGSGKSLTARSILRLLPPNARAEGSITFDERPVLTMSRPELQRFRSRDVAMIFQDPRAHINPIRSIGDFLVEGLVDTQGTDRRTAAAKAIRLLDEVGVASAARRMGQRPHELSGGLLQRVMIAAALAIEPRLILADEISTALDVTTQEEVMAILDELRRERGLGMIFISHDLDLAAAVCDRLAVMKDGRIVETLASDALDAAGDPYTVALMNARVAFGAREPDATPAAGDHND